MVHDNLPILVCGKGGGTIKPGRHVVVSPQPLNNLYLAMLDRMETPVDRLGDSTGGLAKLEVSERVQCILNYARGRAGQRMPFPPCEGRC